MAVFIIDEQIIGKDIPDPNIFQIHILLCLQKLLLHIGPQTGNGPPKADHIV